MKLDEARKILEEKTSTIRRNNLVKRRTFAGRSAIQICKQMNPSLYRKYKKHKDLFKGLKQKINRIYGAKARANANKKIR